MADMVHRLKMIKYLSLRDVSTSVMQTPNCCWRRQHREQLLLKEAPEELAGDLLHPSGTRSGDPPALERIHLFAVLTASV